MPQKNVILRFRVTQAEADAIKLAAGNDLSGYLRKAALGPSTAYAEKKPPESQAPQKTARVTDFDNEAAQENIHADFERLVAKLHQRMPLRRAESEARKQLA